MATKRMFSKDIVRTDRFLDMSLSTQALYFHLCMDADVKGFVSPKAIMRLINASIDDLNVLITKGFVIIFKSGVIVVTDWNIHNNVREDRESPTQYINESMLLLTTTEGKYELLDNSRSTPAQIRLDKIRLDKIRVSENTLSKFSKRESITKEVINELANKHNVNETFVADCWDSAVNWCNAKGKIQKDYKAFLSNWVKREKANYVLKNKQNLLNKETIIKSTKFDRFGNPIGDLL